MMSTKMTNTIKRRYNRISSIFNLMDNMMPEGWRKELLKEAQGKVLEIGVGTGTNLPYYPDNIDLTAIDFSPKMLEKAKEKTQKNNHAVALLEMDAENLIFEDNSFDTIISTCVFCSVPDPVQGLKEIHRVLKPSGKVLMLEHMRSDHPVIGKGMDFLNPIGLHIVGANINRRTMENIEQSGLKVESQVFLMGSVMRKITLTKKC
ncbi:phosphatidylethanolamine N-methyltransferase /phosphatidyl-N-methylethanolamine N-methyltransferase [Saliterribacillus persicus]|uniref:Phosphatidylethanolamine N-methyltransferase /phosphatidyl-N-methylethanolamine N-methyltransferase n=2 Tax=Saliterribacillus persicus TaxID=930114 RepID=A0A368XUT9_9BACI|nr:phosphatidylethanolamine N-methyltransferase /phosphatidyl-N-methylethanolamine N-methyltransferase [Saliterribacillus persicus]